MPELGNSPALAPDVKQLLLLSVSLVTEILVAVLTETVFVLSNKFKPY